MEADAAWEPEEGSDADAAETETEVTETDEAEDEKTEELLEATQGRDFCLESITPFFLLERTTVLYCHHP